MNLNRETLKNLISEAIKELSEEESQPQQAQGDPEAGQENTNLDGVEERIKDELDKYLQGSGATLKKMVEAQTAGKSAKIKARILTVIAASFGISAEETRQDLSTAQDQLRGK